MRFTESHEWVSLEGRKGRIGITDYAQKELGEIVYVELPKVGQMVRAGEEVCVLESTKAAADIYSPVSGKVLAVNEALQETPSLLNRAAEGEGWLFQIELLQAPEGKKEVERLLSRTDYFALIGR